MLNLQHSMRGDRGAARACRGARARPSPARVAPPRALPPQQQQPQPLHQQQPQQQSQQQPLQQQPPPGRGPTALAAVAAPVAPPATTGGADVEFLGVLDGMQTVRGVMELEASPDLVYKILTDYDRCSEVFENISASQTFEEDGAKTVVQACSWRFLAFSGSFNVHLSVYEDERARSLVFRLVKSSFMRDFEGRWQVLPAAPGGPDCAGGGSGLDGSPARARVEHVLAVKPLMPIPAAVARYTQGIFTRQVANILRDLEREVSAKSAEVGGGGGGSSSA